MRRGYRTALAGVKHVKGDVVKGTLFLSTSVGKPVGICFLASDLLIRIPQHRKTSSFSPFLFTLIWKPKMKHSFQPLQRRMHASLHFQFNFEEVNIPKYVNRYIH